MRCFSMIMLGVLLAGGCGDSTGKKEDGDQDGDGGGKSPVPVGNEAYASAAPVEQAITAETVSADEPKILFNGTDYSLLWRGDNGRTLVFQRIALTGSPATEPKVIYTATQPTAMITEGRYSWAWSGSKYLIVFQAAGVFAGMIDKDGTVVREFALADTNPLRGFPVVASNGTDFLLAYTTQRATSSPSEIRVRRIAADGTSGDEVTVSADPYSFHPDLVWHAGLGKYALVWVRNESAGSPDEIYFATVAADGTGPSQPVAVTPADGFGSKDPVLGVLGEGFGLLYRDFGEVKLGTADPLTGMPHIRLCILDGNGTVRNITGDDFVDRADHFLISSPYEEEAATPHFAVSGSEWGIVWGAQSAPYLIYYTQARLDGGVMMSARKKIISAQGTIAMKPQIAANTTGGFFTVWQDERGNGAFQIYGAR